jgi:hypothetical protein
MQIYEANVWTALTHWSFRLYGLRCSRVYICFIRYATHGRLGIGDDRDESNARGVRDSPAVHHGCQHSANHSTSVSLKSPAEIGQIVHSRSICGVRNVNNWVRLSRYLYLRCGCKSAHVGLERLYLNTSERHHFSPYDWRGGRTNSQNR